MDSGLIDERRDRTPHRWMTLRRNSSRLPFQLPRGTIQNHHLRELASRRYAPTAIQKANGLISGIKMKTPTTKAIAIISESKNPK
jgi:hypothetical protein